MSNLTLHQTILAIIRKNGGIVDDYWPLDDPEGSAFCRPTIGYRNLPIPSGAVLQSRSSSVRADSSGLQIGASPLHIPMENVKGKFVLWVGLESDTGFMVNYNPLANRPELQSSGVGDSWFSNNAREGIGAEVGGSSWVGPVPSTYQQNRNFIGGRFISQLTTYNAPVEEGVGVSFKLRHIRLGMLVTVRTPLTNINQVTEAIMTASQQALNPVTYTGVSLFDYITQASPTWWASTQSNSGQSAKTLEMYPLKKSLVSASPWVASANELLLSETYELDNGRCVVSTNLSKTVLETQPASVTSVDADHIFYIGAILNPTSTTYPVTLTGDVNVGSDVLIRAVIKTHRTDGSEVIVSALNCGAVTPVTSNSLPIGVGVTEKEMSLEIVHDPVGGVITVTVKVDLLTIKQVNIINTSLPALTTIKSVAHRNEDAQYPAIKTTGLLVWGATQARIGFVINGNSSSSSTISVKAGTGSVAAPLQSSQSRITSVHSNTLINTSYLAWISSPFSNSITSCGGAGVSTGEFTLYCYLAIDSDKVSVPDTTGSWGGSTTALENAPVFKIKPVSAPAGFIFNFNSNNDLVIRIDIHTPAKDIVIPADKVIRGRLTSLIIVRDASSDVTVYMDGAVVSSVINIPVDLGLDLTGSVVTYQLTNPSSGTTSVANRRSYGVALDVAIFNRAMSVGELGRLNEVSGGSVISPSTLEGSYENHTSGVAVAFREDTGEFLLSSPISSGAFSLDIAKQGGVTLALYSAADTVGAGSFVQVFLGPPFSVSAFTPPDGLTGTHKVEGSTYDAGVYVASTVRVYRQDTYAMLGEVTSDAGTGGYTVKFSYTGDVLVVALVNGRLGVTPNITPMPV